MPSVGITVRALWDYEILEYNNLLIAVTIASLFLSAVILMVTKEIKFKKALDFVAVVGMFMFMMSYSFGSYVALNCTFDQSKPKIFHVVIVDKEVSTGQSKSYTLILGRWGSQTQDSRASVNETQYEMLQKGDTVNICLKQGFLKTTWYYVSFE